MLTVHLLTVHSFAQIGLVEAFPNLYFQSPVDFQSAGDGTGRLFIVEKPGKIKVLVPDGDNSFYTSKLFLDISDSILITNWEMGLLGLSFHPNYQNNGYLYVNYTSQNMTTRISRFSVSSNPDSADKTSELIILEFDQPTEIHNGGQLSFGPDNYLYISTGDGGPGGDTSNNAQNLSVLLGKILRIDVDNQDPGLNYAIPPDNPFIEITFARDEIYAYGFRNPWRFSFDSQGRIWSGDVGEVSWEEINIVQKGGNYGWVIMEGTHCFPPGTSCDTTGLINPVHEYSHNGNPASITGGFVYEGELLPQLEGKYIFSDFITKKVWALIYDETNPNNTIVEYITEAPGNISSFGIDQEREIYATTYQGKIYKFDKVNSVAEDAVITNNFILFQNYPNPFNPTTSIKYEISKDSFVNLRVFNILGETVAELVNQFQLAGSHQLIFSANNLPSGIYIYQLMLIDLSSGLVRNLVESKKMILMR
jgi:glucose/arabinose dehydrogenase